MTVRSGIDVLQDNGFVDLRGLRVALFSSSATVNRDLTRTVDVLYTADSVELVALFGAEHGFGGGAADGVPVTDAVDSRYGLPVYSLYGDTYAPTPDMLKGIDAVVCDIQDIGIRYYTFVWTLTHILEACGAHGVPIYVLDRPNPLGGEIIFGGPMNAAHASIVGRYDIPVQHGLTIAEFATFANQHWNETPAEVNVIQCNGWRRSMTWNKIKWPFVPPSPNMPHISTVQHYPGSCLIEGTTLSEGRGTALPFEIVGAPGINSIDFADALNALSLDGVRFRPHQFKPNAGKHAGAECGGVQVHITDIARFHPFETWLQVLYTLQNTLNHSFAWKAEHFDRLIGSSTPRKQLDAGVPVTEIISPWNTYEAAFRQQRKEILLYD